MLIPAPARVPQGDLPPTIHVVIAADQLIQTNRRQWGFEAYQDLALLANSYEPARLLRDCLEAIPSCYQRSGGWAGNTSNQRVVCLQRQSFVSRPARFRL